MKYNINFIKWMYFFRDLSRQNSFTYINRYSLNPDYFKRAEESLNDGFIYLIFTNSKSISSKVIRFFTKKDYNHISIAFDSNLSTIVSYNGGAGINLPGMNPESLNSLTIWKGAYVSVYKLPATHLQKRIILNKISEINVEGNSYNLIGLLMKNSFKPNIMFCSQFVYLLLRLVDLNYFEKDETKVKPYDFIELDINRKLIFINTFTLDTLIKDMVYKVHN